MSLHAPNDELRTELVPLNKQISDRRTARRVRALRRTPAAHDDHVRIHVAQGRQRQARACAPADQADAAPAEQGQPDSVQPVSTARATTRSGRRRRSARSRRSCSMPDVLTMVRRTRGDDIDAACGQLKGQVMDRTRRQAEFRRKLEQGDRACGVSAPCGFASVAAAGACSPRATTNGSRRQEGRARRRRKRKRLACTPSSARSTCSRASSRLALDKLNKALSFDPNYADAHTVIAVLYEHIGDAKQAEEHYRRAAQLKPKGGNELNNYGAFLCKLGRYDEAARLFRSRRRRPVLQDAGCRADQFRNLPAQGRQADPAEKRAPRGAGCNNRRTTPKRCSSWLRCSIDKGDYFQRPRIHPAL